MIQIFYNRYIGRNKLKTTNVATLAIGILLASCATQAATVRLDFTVENFISATPPAPTDPVTGTIFWEAESIWSPIDQFLSIDMVINEHVYDDSELAFEMNNTRFIVGGMVGGAGAVRGGEDDFLFAWEPSDPQVFAFTYSICCTGPPGQFHSGLVLSSYSLTVVPIPAAVWLFGSALGLLGWMRRRR